MRFKPIFAWYDLWVGVFIDRAKRRVYIFPLPCIGIVVTWRPKFSDTYKQARGVVVLDEPSEIIIRRGRGG